MFKGYERSDDYSKHMGKLLYRLLRRYPDMRLGQLISWVTKDSDQKLFNLFDEELVALLDKFDKEHNGKVECNVEQQAAHVLRSFVQKSNIQSDMGN